MAPQLYIAVNDWPPLVALNDKESLETPSDHLLNVQLP
jgi:hypothetical protein